MGLLSPTSSGLLSKPTAGIDPYVERFFAPNLFTLSTQKTQQSTTPVPNLSSTIAAEFIPSAARSVVGGVATAGTSLAQSVASPFQTALTGNYSAPSSFPDLNIPILGKIPVESAQARAARYVNQGDQYLTAAAKSLGLLATEEPFGFAFKPFIFGAGLLGRSGRIEQVAADLAKIGNAADAANYLKGIGFTEEVANRFAPKAAKETDLVRMQKLLNTAEDTQRYIAPKPGGVSRLARDAGTIADEPLLNTAHFNISDAGRSVIDAEISALKPDIESIVGRPLSNNEVLKAAQTASDQLSKVVSREDTAAYNAALLRLRQDIAAEAQSGVVSKEFLQNLVTLKSTATDIGRKLQSFVIGADPKKATSMQAVLQAVMRVNDNLDEILEAAKGVDFNNAKQAVEFYRRFVKPKVGEWIDLIRYNSMLSSPKTHIINTFTNIINSVTVPVLEKAIRGGLDLLSSKAFGKGRTRFSKEALAYLDGYRKSFKSAVNRFAEVMKGERAFTNLDLRNIPLATKGPGAALEKALVVPTKMLEGMDQFFMELVTGGEKAALAYRQAKGVPIRHPEIQADEAARYLLFRKEPGDKRQGYLLRAIDTMTSLLSRLREDANPLVSYPAKFTFPFIQTPTNILKQGVEFSPLGYATILGAKDPVGQAIKATIGSTVALAGASLALSNRMTWGEPKPTADKNAFRAAGMQPYSIKLGDRWYSYQKLPPFLAFPLSQIAVVADAYKNKKIDDQTLDVLLSAFSQYAGFFADQSYFKSMGDLWSAINGDEYATSRLLGNYPQQFVPYRALGGWLARIADDTQRQIDNKANFAQKQIELLMMNVPGLSQKLPPRLDAEGKPIPNREPVLNAFSPIQSIPQNKEQQKRYSELVDLKRTVKDAKARTASLNDEAETTWENLKVMPKEQAATEFDKYVKTRPDLAAKMLEIYKEEQKGLSYEDRIIKQLNDSNGDQARYIKQKLDSLSTNEEKAGLWDEYVRKGVITDKIAAQIQQLSAQTP